MIEALEPAASGTRVLLCHAFTEPSVRDELTNVFLVGRRRWFESVTGFWSAHPHT